MMRGKKGYKDKPIPETGSGAAVVIGIITVILIFYILFLPPEQRAELLAVEGEAGTGIPGTVNNTLLTEPIGRLEFVSPEGEMHNIPPVNLFLLTNAETIASFTPTSVRNGWFDKVKKNLTFSIPDLQNTDDVILSFSAAKHKGILRVRLNDNLIYEYDIATYNIAPIPLDKTLLRQNNNIELEVSGVGMAFWSTNEYQLEDIQVIGYITDISRQKAENTFTISSTEKYNLERATFNFYPDCEPAEVGTLEIYLNNRKVYDSVPDCDTENRFELYTNDLNTGKNSVVFKTTKGRYTIDQVYVDTDLKEVSSFIQYFQITEPMFAAVVEGRADIVLEIFFVDDGQKKRGELNINGHLSYLDQTSPYYARNINPFIGPGNNYIELRPEATMNINELRITIY